MRILFLSQLLPYPLDAGPRLRSYYVLRSLAKQHEVTLVAFGRGQDTPTAQVHLAELCAALHVVPLRRSRLRDGWAFLRSRWNGLPFLIARDADAGMRRCLYQLAQQQTFDVVHADQLWMAPYALAFQSWARASGRQVPRLVLDQHNAVFQIPARMAENRGGGLRWLLQDEAKRLSAYEADVCLRFDRVVWVTNEDFQAVQGQMSAKQAERLASKSRVIPICIAALPEQVCQPEQGDGVLFVGGMHWPPNAEGMRWFAEQVWPLVRSQLQTAHCVAVGRQPPVRLTVEEGFVTPGYVTDAEPYWRAARLFVVPLLSGGGMRVKILDAWAHGVPVISTTIGAEGIEYRDGQDLWIADASQDMAEKIMRLLKDGATAGQLGRAGRRRLEERYDWQVRYQEWGAVYEDLMSD